MLVRKRAFAPIAHRIRSIVASIIVVFFLSGCSAYDKLQKSHEAMVTLQEADRQFSIEDTGEDQKPDDRAAVSWIERSIALMPHSPIPYVGDGTDPGIIAILQNRGRYPLLISLLQTALRDPELANNSDLLLGLGDAEERDGPSPAATATYAKTVAAINKTLATSGSTIDVNDEQILDRARAEYYGGMRSQSLKDYHSIISTASTDDIRAEAENDLAYFMSLDKSDLPQAKKLSTAAVAVARSAGDDSVFGVYEDTLSWVLHQQGDDSNALLYEEEAASLDPLEADIQYHLGEICRSSGRLTEARIAYRTAIKLNPFYSQARASLLSLPQAVPGQAV